MASETEKALQEITEIALDENKAQPVRSQAIDMLIDLNGSEDGRKMLEQNDRVYKAMSYIIEQNKFFVVISKALKFYVNASTFQNFDFMMKVLPNPEFLVACVVDSDNHFADLISFILSNLSRSEAAADYLSVLFKPSIEKLVEAYCNENYNKKSRVLHYLGLMLANLAVTRKGRVLLREKNHFVRLVSFINHPKSLTRRRAAVQLARNFCLDVDQHSFLLSYDEDTGLEKINSNTEEYDTESDLLIKLLKPLCDGSDQSGDTENGDLDDEDIGKLPLDLQYLDEDVKREQDPEMRQLLVESVWLLCSTKKGRMTMKNCGVYQLIRRLHMFECGNSKKKYDFEGQGEKSSVAEAELKLIELLIADEPDKPELENFMTVEVPPLAEEVEEKNPDTIESLI